MSKHVSPRTLKRRTGRAIRKSRRERALLRARWASVGTGLTSAVVAFAGFGVAIQGAIKAMADLERVTAAMRACQVVDEVGRVASRCADRDQHVLMERCHCGYDHRIARLGRDERSGL